MRLLIQTCILVVALSVGVFAQVAAGDNAVGLDRELANRIDDVFRQYDKPGSPGCSLAVVRDGKVVYKHGYGYANLEYDIPISPSTVFHVASVSKQFTAFAITLLASEGRLKLDDDIRKYLPEVPDFGKTITIKHLIYHTSGLRDQWELLAMAGWRLDDVITREHILKIIRNEKELNFEPGAEHLYCNSGYTLLAVIVERVSGQSFRQFTTDRIFKPLGMANTHFHDDHKMIVKNRAYSYQPEKAGGFKLSALNYANAGATSLFTTAEDMTRWALNFEDMKLGGKAVIDQMHEQGILNSGKKIDYAFGLAIGKYKGLSVVEHSGGDAGYRSHIMRFPEQRFSVIVLSNLSTTNPGGLARKVADLVISDKLVADTSPTGPAPNTSAGSSARPTVRVSSDILDSYVGKYELAGTIMVDITRENDRLIAAPQGQEKAELFPQSETKFFLKIIDAQVEFQRDSSGRVSQFTLQQNGQSLIAKRLASANDIPSDLSEYTGSFYSEELGTAYNVVLKEGKLVAQHRRHDDIQMTPITRDKFTGSAWWFSRVNYTRDKNGHINGFNLSGGRVRNMRFTK